MINTKTIDFFTSFYKPLHIYKDTRQILTLLYNKIQKYDNNDANKILKNAYNPIQLNDIPKGNMWQSILDEIQQTIIESLNHYYLVEYKINSNKIRIFFIGNNLKIPFIKKTAHKMAIWLQIAYEYSNAQCAKELNIYIYLMNNKKVLPLVKGAPIGQINANTAMTTSCQLKGEINIYRTEEFFKVFIHESFHTLGLDFSKVSTKMQTDYIKKNVFPIQQLTDIRLAETYCETWATIINLIFKSYYNSPNKKIEIKQIEQYIQYEQNFSIFQLNKILHHYGLNEYGDLYNPTESFQRFKWNENTQVLAYYILKPICLFHIDDFFKFSLNSGVFTLQYELKNVSHYCQFFKDNYRCDKYLEYIIEINRSIKDSNKKISPFLATTLRMTLFG